MRPLRIPNQLGQPEFANAMAWFAPHANQPLRLRSMPRRTAEAIGDDYSLARSNAA